MTTKQIIERRLNSKQEDWKNNYFDTCDAIAYGDGEFKIIKNCKLLKQMNSKTELENGAIKLNKEQYKKLKGKTFKNPTKEEVWKYLLEDLYEPYIELLGCCPNFYINKENFMVRAWCVNRSDRGDRSIANAGVNLDYGLGRFASIASEMQEKIT